MINTEKTVIPEGGLTSFTACSSQPGTGNPPRWWESSLRAFHFYERPTLVPVFFLANWKKSQENFCFYKKRLKVNKALSVCFCSKLLERQRKPEQQGWHPHQAPQDPHSISASGRHHFERSLWGIVLYLNLSCASISKMYPKVIAYSLYTISAYERFHGKALLPDSEGNLYQVFSNKLNNCWTPFAFCTWLDRRRRVACVLQWEKRPQGDLWPRSGFLQNNQWKWPVIRCRRFPGEDSSIP